MNVFLLNWNPDKWDELTESEIQNRAHKTSSGVKITGLRWATGSRNSGITPGDQVMLLRQGADRRGLLARGIAVSEIYQDTHWSDPEKSTNYVDWEAIEFLSIDDRLPTEILLNLDTKTNWNYLQGSGVKLPDHDAETVTKKWNIWYEKIIKNKEPSEEPKWWLCSLNITEAVSQARSTYSDMASSSYNWSTRSRIMGSPRKGDRIIIRDEKFCVLGFSVIEDVRETEPTVETANACPHCGKRGNVRERKEETPRFKCYLGTKSSGCGKTFETPTIIEIPNVIHFETSHKTFWIELDIPSTSSEINQFSHGGQASIRPVEPSKFKNFLISNNAANQIGVIERLGEIGNKPGPKEPIPGGHRKRVVQTRNGQGKFRKALLEKFGETCAISGPTPKSALDACHLYSYAVIEEHEEHGGLLLRKDLHRLFDDGLLSVDTKTERIRVNESLKSYEEYWRFNQRKLQIGRPLNKREKYWLEEHFATHSDLFQ
tara:strand:- start:264 stop:1724 length:1461 start_codon:yes stop_codon:yes gene_type:complete